MSMKPVILITEKNLKGMIELAEEELKQLITDAYEQGYEDGKKQNQTPIYIPPMPSNPPNNWWDRQIYCDANLNDAHSVPNPNIKAYS